MNHSITLELQIAFSQHLRLEEKSSATIDKYSRDVRTFVEFVCGREIDKALVLEYKNALLDRYTVTSANSMLAALNAFFRFCGWPSLLSSGFVSNGNPFIPKKRS